MSDTFSVPGLVGTDGPPIEAKPLSLNVTVFGKQAVLHLSEPREYVALTHAEPIHIGARLFVAAVEADPSVAKAAIAGAMAVMDAIYELRADIKPAGGAVKHELIERHRKTLTTRLSLILNTQREDRNISHHALAKQLVDVMLHEVFA